MVWAYPRVVLSPLLFNIYMSDIGSTLPAHVRAAQYANDLLVYSRGVEVLEAKALLGGLLLRCRIGCCK